MTVDTRITTWIAIQMCSKGREMAMTFRAFDGVVFSMGELQRKQIEGTLILVPLPFTPTCLIDTEIYRITFIDEQVQVERTF